MQNMKPKQFKGYKPKDILKKPAVTALVGQGGFRNNKSTLAIIGAGGTISSSYYFNEETIHPSSYNPINERIHELEKAFHIANKDFSYLSLLTKDSRDITKKDVRFLIDFIDSIDNEQVILSCGTFGIPNMVRILDKCDLKKSKIICVTGSLLPSCFKNDDCDVNIGAALSSINAIKTFGKKGKKSTVFGSFHGEIFLPKDCKHLNLHPPGSQQTACTGRQLTNAT